MRLRRVLVEGFRAVRSLFLELDECTVMIGENDSGKSSIVDALELCLGAEARGDDIALDPRDFHRPPGEEARAVRIELGFDASEGDEARQPRAAEHAPRGPSLEVVAHPPLAGERVLARWRILDARGRPMKSADGRRTLRELRRRHPVVVLRGGAARGLGCADRAAPPSPAASVEQQIRALYERMTLAPADVGAEEFSAGFAIAREYALRADAGLVSRDDLPRWLVGDGDGDDGGLRSFGAGALAPYTTHGIGAQRIALLLLVGALLETWARIDAGGEARPLLVLEDPEAHLHPMTLASMWDLLQALRVQKLVTTYSAELLKSVPLPSLRRVERRGPQVRVHAVGERTLTAEEQRKIGYHVRSRRGIVLFGRAWLLVEGETEFWLLPEMARLLGHDLDSEGVHCVEFAQCGVEPLAKLANALGIEWHLLADGDEAGRGYAAAARAQLRGALEEDHLTLLEDTDLEHYLWRGGYAEVYAGRRGSRARRVADARSAIRHALSIHSKPALALAVLDAMAEPGSPGVPPALASAIGKVVRLARR